MFTRKMRKICVFLTAILVIIEAEDLSVQLQKNPSKFVPCERELCFVFKSEKPIVNLDPSMRTTEQQKLFKCRNRAELFPELEGPFFDVIDNMVLLRNALCIWAGPNSTFDGMIEFVRNVSRGERPYRFVVGGNLFQMSYRISNGSIPSASLSNGKIVLVSNNRKVTEEVSDAMKCIIGPFGQSTWYLCSGFIIVFAVLYFLINFSFATTKTLTIIVNAILEPFVPRHWLTQVDPNDVAPDNKARDTRAFLINVWKRGALLFFLISALFWEIGVVNFVTNDRPHVSDFSLRGMKLEKLEQFVVNSGSAFEHILRDLGLPEAIEVNPKPWRQVHSFDEIFDKLSLAPKNEKRFAIVSDKTALYELNIRGLCSKLAVHDTNEPLPDFSAVWYYSSHVDLNKRSAIDHSISRLREQGKIEKIIEASVGRVPLTCGLTSHSISIFVIFVPLAVVLFPFFLFIMTALLARLLLQKKERRKRVCKYPKDDSTCTGHSSEESSSTVDGIV